MVTGKDPYHSGWKLEHGWVTMRLFFFFFGVWYMWCELDEKSYIYPTHTHHTLTKLRKATQNIQNDSDMMHNKNFKTEGFITTLLPKRRSTTG
jgi:hypothetical protein